jgi:hypothetical protein
MLSAARFTVRHGAVTPRYRVNIIAIPITSSTAGVAARRFLPTPKEDTAIPVFQLNQKKNAQTAVPGPLLQDCDFCVWIATKRMAIRI